MALLDISIPIITFFLGSIFTLLMKKRESRREIINRNLNEICDHVNEWYNQIHAIFVDLKFSDNPNLTEKKIYTYNYNRLVLPKLIRNLETLKKHKECEEIVREVEGFLALVTNMRSRNSDEKRINCMAINYEQFMIIAMQNNHLEVNPTFQEKFGLKTLTSCTQSRVSEALSSLSKSSVDKETSKIERFEFLLIQLDSIVQKINKQAAKLEK